MPIQLPKRRDVRGNRKYAQPITRRNIKAVQGQRDPGAAGGPNAAATPLAFGGGKGLIDAGTDLQILGAQWRQAELRQQSQRNALLLERLTILIKDGVDRITGGSGTHSALNMPGGGQSPFGNPSFGSNTPKNGLGLEAPEKNDFIDENNVLNTPMHPHWNNK